MLRYQILTVATAMAIAWSGSTFGQNVDYFRTVNSGPFRNAALWIPFNPLPPALFGPGGTTDDAHFDLGQSFFEIYLITEVNGINDQLIVEDDAVRLDIEGLYQVASSLGGFDSSIVVGQSSGDVGTVVFSGDSNDELRSVIASIGAAAGSTGTVIVNGSDLTWNSTGTIVVGLAGTGNFVILDGTVNSEDGIVGYGAAGTVTVSGANSQWNIDDELFLEIGGQAILEIEAGGHVTCHDCESEGTISLDGTNSMLNVVDLLFCQGISAQNGAYASCNDCVVFDVMQIDGAQSELFASNKIEIRDHGFVSNGAKLTAGSEICFEGAFLGQTLLIHGDNSSLATDQLMFSATSSLADLTVSGGASVDCTTANITGFGTRGIAEAELKDGSSWGSCGLSIGAMGAATFRVEAGSTAICDTCNIGGLSDHGLLQVLGAGSTLLVSDHIRLGTESSGVGSGILQIDEGEVSIVNELIVDDESEVVLVDGRLTVGSVELMAGSLFDFSGGVLQVKGVDGDLSNDGGLFSPDLPAGVSLITGNYVQACAGSLQIELGGSLSSEFDSIDIGGNAMLDGQLEIALISRFQPAKQQTFAVLTASSIGGSFSNVTDNQRLETTGGEGSFLVRYGISSPSPNQILLSDFEPAFVLGDINGDGEINLLDIGPFVELLNSGGFDPAADINMDGDVNLLDVGPFIALLAG